MASEGDAADVCAVVCRWSRLNGGRSVRVSIGRRIAVPDCPDGLRRMLARHGWFLIDGAVCEEARWRRT